MATLTVERFDEDIEERKIRVENPDVPGEEVEMPHLEASILLRAFVEQLEREIETSSEEHRHNSNDLARIIDNSDLLDEGEMTQLLSKNKKEAGKVEGKREIKTVIWRVLNKFITEKSVGA